MTEEDAVALIGGRPIGNLSSAWADLGCGDGTFTRALATLLPGGSVIHAMDRDASALRQMPKEYAGVSIITHVGDFTIPPWPFERLDGLLLANSLHYVRDQPAFVRACASAMNDSRRFLIVEYDTDHPNRWVPYPLSRIALRQLFNDAGYSSVTFLESRRSQYQRGEMYSAMVAGAT